MASVASMKFAQLVVCSEKTPSDQAELRLSFSGTALT